MDLLLRAVVAAVVVVTSGGVLQPDAGNGVSEIHAVPSSVPSVKGVGAFRGTPRPDATAAPSPSLLPGAPPPARAVRRTGTAGIATWYCCTRGHGSGEYVAAAGPALRVGSWRGRYVRVCASRCIRVRLLDWCRCSPSRVIDLHPGAFRALAPLWRGVVRVSVAW